MADKHARNHAGEGTGKCAGLTLVELLVVLAVAAILAQIALPNFSEIIQNNRSATQLNDLQTSLTFARSEAIKRNRSVGICKANASGTACQDSGVNWHAGWLVFEDLDNSGDFDAGETILSVHGALTENTTLKFTPARVVYTGTGLASQGVNGTYTLCDDRGAGYSKGLIIAAGGRPRLAIDSDANGIPEDASGSDLSCS